MLDLCEELFNQFELNCICYCHWKSNEHLGEGLEGKTDLDILVDKSQYLKINSILFSVGLKRYEAVNYLKYISIEDYIGFDDKTGRLIHIHLHYELKIGKKFIKEYHLPFEKYIFNNLPPKDNYGLQEISPNIEIILLLIRFTLKNQYTLSFNKSILTKEYQIEFDWLVQRIDINILKKNAADLLGNDFSEKLIQYILNNNNWHYYKQLQKSTLNTTSYYKTNSSWKLFITYYLSQVKALYNYILFKKLGCAVPYRRTLSTGGKVIAFIGVDGAGKSTLIKELQKWLNWKIDVVTLYFGSGNGTSSFLRYPLVAITNLIKRIGIINKNTSVNNNEIEQSEKLKKNILYQLFKIVWAITLAFEKKRKFKKMWNAKAKGLIILCDRFPQTQIHGFNDGPLLTKWSNNNNFVKRNIAKWEFNIYKISEIYKPDIVIKLIIPAEISVKRKSDTSIEMIRKKIEAISLMKFAEEVTVHQIDSSGNMEDTLLEIKKFIAEL